MTNLPAHDADERTQGAGPGPGMRIPDALDPREAAEAAAAGARLGWELSAETRAALMDVDDALRAGFRLRRGLAA